VGSPAPTTRSNTNPAGSFVPIASAQRTTSSGTAGALYASACGRITALHAAWASPYDPPSTWQVRWWRPTPTDASTAPARYAPYNKSPRTSTSCGSRATSGTLALSTRIPSTASSVVTGLAPSPQPPSTQCASALHALATLVSTGRPTVSCG